MWNNDNMGDRHTDTHVSRSCRKPAGASSVTVLTKGTFVTIAGISEPNPATCPGTLQTGGVTGTTWGDYSVTTGTGVTFDPYATVDDDPSLDRNRDRVLPVGVRRAVARDIRLAVPLSDCR